MLAHRPSEAVDFRTNSQHLRVLSVRAGASVAVGYSPCSASFAFCQSVDSSAEMHMPARPMLVESVSDA